MLQQEVEEKNKLLIEKACSLTENNELIKYCQQKLEDVKIEGDYAHSLDSLLNDIAEFSKVDVWLEFDEYFNDLYPKYKNRLLTKAKKLTKYELRICFLVKLGLATKDIAIMMRKTVKSVEVARTRIRKKLKLERSETLFSYLNNL